VKIHVEFFLVLTPCSDVVEYQHLGGPCCLHLQVVTSCSDVVGSQRFGGQCCPYFQGDDGGSMVLRNVGVLAHHYTVSHL